MVEAEVAVDEEVVDGLVSDRLFVQPGFGVHRDRIVRCTYFGEKVAEAFMQQLAAERLHVVARERGRPIRRLRGARFQDGEEEDEKPDHRQHPFFEAAHRAGAVSNSTKGRRMLS